MRVIIAITFVLGCVGLVVSERAQGQTVPAEPPSVEAPAGAPASAAPPGSLAPSSETGDPGEPAPAAPAGAPASPAGPGLGTAAQPIVEQAPPIPAVTTEPQAEPATEPAPPPKELTVGTEGVFKPGLLLQAWFLLDRADETATTFRVRRAEISAKGEIVPKLVAYAVMLDPAKVLEPRDKTVDVANQDPAPSDPSAPEQVTVKQPESVMSVFQDLFITFQSEYVDASVGQFKIPVSWEGYNSSSKLLFAERSAVAREFGDKRDMGLRLAKSFEYVGYSAGLFNGSTLNNLDTNNEKDVALRLEGYPVKGLVLGGVVYATVGDRDADTAKDRYEGDIRFETGPFLVQAEYIRSRDVGSSGATKGQGFYGALAYTLGERFQPAVRLGYLDPNVDADVDPATAKNKDELWQYDVGLNYLIRGHEAKLQLNYYRQQYDDRTPNNEVILAAQASF